MLNDYSANVIVKEGGVFLIAQLSYGLYVRFIFKK